MINESILFFQTRKCVIDRFIAQYGLRRVSVWFKRYSVFRHTYVMSS